MIPDHLIGQAAAAIYASSVFGDRFALDAWRDMNDDNPVKTTTRELARAALEAVAADIWDEGADAGEIVGYGIGRDNWAPRIANPYRATETA